LSLYTLVALSVVAAVAGCASAPKPACQKSNAQLFQTPAGQFYVFDEQNMNMLLARIQGIQEGTCDPEPWK